jgi:CheY-like chemotaxis protein
MKYLAFVIEDHVDVSLLYLRALVEAGFQPVIIRDGQEAMERLARECPALIILDLHIPHVSGEKILNYVRSQERLKHTKVIIATGDSRYTEADYPQADLFLVKPITYSQMMDFADRFKGTWPAR